MEKPPKKSRPPLDPEKYASLKAEAQAPYKGLRKFFYLAFAASGFIGAVVFLAKLAAGKEVGTNLPNFALQIGVVALMIFLFRLESK
ncbi:DUF3493 domain-containing protein [Cyanothece sp. BG0011]|uniref:DUF3493 domain-containing protein n=1 Tax=Cyanothece sp. BG0011 TaxID=2082950 RepID=UPI000D1E9B06|nr:DUF3493 domain-containing protein [Cyanothece sp. BG0011]